MKKILPLLIAIGLFQVSFGQQFQTASSNNSFPKTITITGSAEMEIVPDEIYVNIELKEYQKKGEAKKDLETIKNQFLAYCKEVGLPDSVISIASYSGAGNYYNFRKKKKGSDLFSAITYQVKFNKGKTLDELVEKLDDDATQSFVIVSTSHSKIEEYRKQLKIKAVQAAKEKGIYLSESIGEKIGETITINEPTEWQPSLYDNLSLSNTIYRDSIHASPSTQDVDFKKMKLRYEVSVIFALK